MYFAPSLACTRGGCGFVQKYLSYSGLFSTISFTSLHLLGDDHGDVQDPLSQLDSDDDVDSDDDIIAMKLPDGFRLQESPPVKLDRALIKRCVFLRRGMGWFLGQISRAAPPQTSHTYDYRVILAYDRSTISVKMPLDAYDVDEAKG